MQTRLALSDTLATLVVSDKRSGTRTIQFQPSECKMPLEYYATRILIALTGQSNLSELDWKEVYIELTKTIEGVELFDMLESPMASLVSVYSTLFFPEQ